ncbi:hypothetical protein Hanom_Chr09g00835621 [Helianthus anomalus]
MICASFQKLSYVHECVSLHSCIYKTSQTCFDGLVKYNQISFIPEIFL